MREWIGWLAATQRALYGVDGFYRRAEGPAGHFRTSVHASPLFGGALATLLAAVDADLGHPTRLDVVDVGAGRGELLRDLLAAATRCDPGLASRLRLVGVEVVGRPAGLPPEVGWASTIADACPSGVLGLLIGNEWLDTAPVEVAERAEDGVRLVEVEPASGAQRLGPLVHGADARWLAEWWPLADAPVGARAEIGLPRDRAWADAVGSVRRGLAVAIDYGHVRADRPADGTLRAFRSGRVVAPTPDGGCDITSDVAFDSCRAAAVHVAGGESLLTTQRAALRALGVVGQRPPHELARRDPVGYLRMLAAAGEAAELTARGGMGEFRWLAHAIGVPIPAALAAAAASPAG